ncbi:hypothetical protein [Pseudorhodoplanes sp.]|uniref:hypothetical protein n=1 Tax=Pseudorhodoplanes sp. TaxID=1934341 RepID=UPI003D13B456
MSTDTDLKEKSYTIAEWCAMRKYSKPTFHKMRREGKAPKVLVVLSTLRITETADREWEAERMKEAETEAARLEAARRAAHAKHAAQAAAKSNRHVSKRGKKKRAA